MVIDAKKIKTARYHLNILNENEVNNRAYAIDNDSSKSKERERQRETERDRETERVKNGNKNITWIDPKQSTPLHKNADNASTKENADNRKDN